MSASAIAMMVVGCGIVWGGVILAITIALVVDKKKAADERLK
ncbi:MetS family NSS transporter small subunit [Acetobacterium malicum]|nr:MetS family NSS transporter small subunit [Acetobacterium dehalogenans]